MKTPSHYCENPSKIRAFVLGCDPTAFDKIERLKPFGERKPMKFDTVFNLDGKDQRYFTGILANLNEIGIRKDEIYVQNMVTDYQKEESSKNKNWVKIARDYITPRIEELDGIDPSRKIPVLLTSELLYKVLLNKVEKRIPAKEFYELKAEIPIAASTNQLARPLIPFYRHRYYSLNRHTAFRDKIRKILLDSV